MRTFFFDNCVSRNLVAALRHLEADDDDPYTIVHLRDEGLPADTDDDAWLAHVGAKGWMAVTVDVRITTTPHLVNALLEANVCAFFLPKSYSRLSRWEQVKKMVMYWEHIKGAARRAKPGDLYRLDLKPGPCSKFELKPKR